MTVYAAWNQFRPDEIVEVKNSLGPAAIRDLKQFPCDVVVDWLSESDTGIKNCVRIRRVVGGVPQDELGRGRGLRGAISDAKSRVIHVSLM